MRVVAFVTALGLLAATCADTGSVDSSAASSASSLLSSIPAVDTSTRSVALEDINFDTFDGNSVSLAEATPALIARLLDVIAPINDPMYEPVGDARWLLADDVVLGYIDEAGNTSAYPVKILNFHEIINTEIAGRAVLISYCPLCASGIVYDRTVGGEVLQFSNTSALYENDMIMVDRSSGSYWWQVTGSAIVGERTGDQLVVLAAQMSRWDDWVRSHPEGRVLQRPTALDYTQDPFLTYGESIGERGTPFPVSADALSDVRLDPGAIVVAADSDDVVVAWPVLPPRTLISIVDGRRLEVVTTASGATVTDLATGLVVPTRTTFWFALVAAFPDLRLETD